MPYAEGRNKASSFLYKYFAVAPKVIAASQPTLQYIKSGLVLQEAKSGKTAEADEAVKTAATERDNLKAQVASLTKKVTDVEAQLQGASKDKQTADKELPNAKVHTRKVYTHTHTFQELLSEDDSSLSPDITEVELD